MESHKTFAIGPGEALMVLANASIWPFVNGVSDGYRSPHWRRGLESVEYYRENYEGALVLFGSVHMSSIYDEGCVCDIVAVSALPEDVEFLYQEFMKIAQQLIKVENGPEH